MLFKSPCCIPWLFRALLLMDVILVKLWVVYLIYTSQKFIWLIFYLNFSFAIKFNRQLSCDWKWTDKIICYIFWVMEIKLSGGFRRFFTVAFLLVLAPAESSNSAGQSNPNLNNLSKASVKIRRNPLLCFLFMVPFFLLV